MEISGNQYEQLQEALLSAYPTPQKLKMMLRLTLNLPLDRYAEGSDYEQVVFNLIGKLESDGKLDDLVQAAYNKNPGNPKLKAFVASLGQGASPTGQIPDQGPGFQWRGPEDDRELQGLLRPRQSIDLSAHFLKKATEQFNAVCRIEHLDKGAIGTGFLIAKNLLLTNYHVIAPRSGDDPKALLDQLRLKFGYLTKIEPSLAANASSNATQNTISQTQVSFQLAPNALLAFSPVTGGLDYALLRVEESISSAPNITPVTWDVERLPDREMGIHLLQHPDGQPMQVTLGENGITGVYERDGLIQYISNTSVGSSGSPCFNDRWEVIALHHAQVAATFGVRCEGILFKAIYREIAPILAQYK
ncbi:MAG: effector-associated domain EAD1-containing protein [Cyanobacteria bacterium J06629_9]